MKQHFSEADLLETYYTRPGESMPIMMHLADCGECAARYERLERKMRSLHSCSHDEKPETFWARQRISIMRRVEQQRTSRLSPTVSRVARIAAAAMLVLVLGALVTWDQRRVIEPSSRQVVESPTQTAAFPVVPLDDSSTRNLVDSSPWQSEELNEYGSMVAWESWVEDPS